MREPSRILFCQCAYAPIIPEELKRAVAERLDHSGTPFLAVTDLCELAARRDPVLAQFAAGGPVRIAACYPRAVQWLFAAAGAPLHPEAAIFNMRVESADLVCAGLLAGEASNPKTEEPVQPATRGAWTPWFPVIDYARCTNCMQCLSFCLFGVYGVDTESRIQVQNQDQCKTNCPACSRVCPEAAIIFPKHAASPINGDAVSETGPDREKMKVDLSALLGGDLHSLLRQRSGSQTRFSKERDPDAALRERQRCLAALAGDIPPEVLMSLPGSEEIARRAEEARAKAQAVRGAGWGGAA